MINKGGPFSETEIFNSLDIIIAFLSEEYNSKHVELHTPVFLYGVFAIPVKYRLRDYFQGLPDIIIPSPNSKPLSKPCGFYVINCAHDRMEYYLSRAYQETPLISLNKNGNKKKI